MLVIAALIKRIKAISANSNAKKVMIHINKWKNLDLDVWLMPIIQKVAKTIKGKAIIPKTI